MAQSDDGVLFDSIKFTTAALNAEVEGYSYDDQNIWNVMQADYGRVAYCIHYWLSDMFSSEFQNCYQGLARRHDLEPCPRVTYTPSECDKMLNGIVTYWKTSNASYQEQDAYFQDQYGGSAHIMHEGSSAARLEL